MGAVEKEFHPDQDSGYDHGADECACHADDHVLPGHVRLLSSSVAFRLKQSNRRYRTDSAPSSVLSLLSPFECAPFLRRLFLAIIREHDVVHKAESTYHIATPPEKD